MGVSHTGFSTTAPWELNDCRTESAQQIQPWASLSPVLGISRFCDSGHVALRPSCCSVMVPTENTFSPEHQSIIGESYHLAQTGANCVSASSGRHVSLDSGPGDGVQWLVF